MDIRDGSDIRIELLKSFGDDKGKLTIGAYVCRYLLGGPASIGSFLASDTKNYGTMMEYSLTPGVADFIFAKSYGNLFTYLEHAISMNLLYSVTRLENGVNIIRPSFGFGYNHTLGHSLSLRISRVLKSQLTTIDVNAKAIMWTSSQPSSSTFYLVGNMSFHLSGSLAGKYRLGFGLGFTHSFQLFN